MYLPILKSVVYLVSQQNNSEMQKVLVLRFEPTILELIGLPTVPSWPVVISI